MVVIRAIYEVPQHPYSTKTAEDDRLAGIALSAFHRSLLPATRASPKLGQRLGHSRSTGQEKSLQRKTTRALRVSGWGGRIRTYGTRYQKPLPYHLATPQRAALITLDLRAVQERKGRPP